MNIEKDKVVGIHYTLTDNDGNVLDSSDGRDPLFYLHGNGNLIPGLEEELMGKKVEDTLKVNIPPEKAYGLRNEELIYTIERSKFPDPEKVEVGMSFTSQTEQGPVNLTVVDVKGDDVVMDANHPLAGRALNFDVSVVEVREASKEEIEHGHVHGPQGHNH